MFKKLFCGLMIFMLIFAQIPPIVVLADDLDTEAPTAPPDFTVTSKTCTSLTLSWESSTDDVGVTGYNIYNSTTLLTTTQDLIYTIDDLTPDTSYTLTVKASDAAGNTSEGSTLTDSTSQDEQPPVAPQNLACTEKTDTTVSISWDATSDNVGVTGYEIYKADTLLADTQELTYTINALTPGTEYTFTVKAKDASNNVSVNNATITVTTNQDDQPPTMPENVTCTDKTETTISLSWDASADNIEVTGYDVYRNDVLIGNSNSTSYDDTGLSSGTSYTYTVKAKDFAGNRSEASEALIAATVDTQAPSAPANLRASAQTSTGVTLTWDASTDNVAVTGYKVFDGTTVVGTTSGATTATLTGLTPGTAYSLTVKAIDAASNESGASNTLVLTTIPGVPTNFSATSTFYVITLSWSAVAGATGYDISDRNGTITSSTATTQTFNAMVYGSNYTYKVRAKNSSGTGAWSSVLSVWTKLPDMSSFTVTEKKNGMQLSWSSVLSATSYDVEIDGSIVANVTTTSYLHADLVTGEIHTYRVRGKNSNTTSQWAGPISKTVVNYTSLSGTISSNRTLTPEEGPYGIIGNLTVAANVTLTINPGTVIRVNPGVYIYVNGKIQANGDELHNINITSMKDSLFGGTGVKSLSDYWARIDINNNGEFNGNYVNVLYGGVYYPTFDNYNFNFYLQGAKTTLLLNNSKIKYSDNCAVTIKNSVNNLNFHIENTTFENIKSAGVYFESTNSSATGSVSITNNTFKECGVAISDRGTTGFTIDNNAFTGNDQISIQINSYGTGTLSVNYNTIKDGTNYPLYVNLAGLQNSIFDYINGNTLTNNIRSGVQVNELAIGGKVAAGKNITISGNRKYIAGCNGIYGVDANGTLNIEQGAWLLADTVNVNLYVDGKLNVNGTITSPVAFTTLRDKDFIGNATGSVIWGGISIGGTGEMKAENAAIRYAQFDNIYCLNGKLSVKYCDISYAGRLAINMSSSYDTVIKYNTFLYNGWCVFSSPDAKNYDLTYNYYGSPYGPTGQVLIPYVNATIYPWLGYESSNKFRYGVDGVNSATGNYSTNKTDLSYDVPGFKLSITRTYNSLDSEDSGVLGKGWKLNYECMVKDYTSKVKKADGSYDTVTIKTLKTVNLLDGRVVTFSQKQDGTYDANDSRNTLVKLSDKSFKMTTTDQYVYNFNSDGYLISVLDKNGNTLSLSYNTTNKLITITDQTGRETSFTYNTQGYISQIKDPLNRTTGYAYNTDGCLTTVTNPMGGTSKYEYDGSGYLAKTKNSADFAVETIVYNHAAGDNQHKVSTLTDKYGNVKTYSYDNANRKTTITDSNNKSTVQEYDSNFTVNKSTDLDNRSVIIEYFLDAEGRNKLWEVKSTTDRNNNKTTSEIDTNGNTTKTINPDSSYKLMTYDDKNNNVSQRDEEGKFTYFIYDADKKNLLKKVQPLNGTDVYNGSTNEGFASTTYLYYTDAECQSLGYKAKGLLKTVTDPDGGETTYTYDNNGYISSVKNAVGKTTHYSYNCVGLLLEEVSPAQHSITYVYDKNGKPIKKVMDGGETYRTVYDAEGNVLQKIQPNQYLPSLDNLTTFEYTGYHGTRYSYNGNGSVHTVNDAGNNITTYIYDLYGNVGTETKPDGAIYRYEYDNLNRISKTYYKEDLSSDEALLEKDSYSILSGGYTQKTIYKYIDGSIYITETYKYDYANRQVEKQNADSTVLTTTYYKNGLEKSTTDANGKTAYSKYDGQNRLSEIWSPFELNGSSVLYAYTTYAYDKSGRKTLEKQGKTTVALYSQPSTYVTTTFEYYADGNLKSKVTSAGVKTGYEYDNAGLLSREKDYVSDTVFNKIEYTNNYWGKPENKKVFVRKGDISEYDFSSDEEIALETDYTYDSNGNVATETNPNGVTTTYSYDNLNRQTSISQPGINETSATVTITTSKIYDYMGNVISRTDANGNQTMFIMNGRGFLVKQVDAKDGTTLNGYDLLGRLTAKVSPMNYLAGQALSSMNRTEYTYDLMSRLKTMSHVYFDAASSQWVSYVSKACKYDNNGNKIKELDNLGYAAGTGATADDKINNGYGIISTYNFANLQLSTLDPVAKDHLMSFSSKYTYDALGNIITKTNATNVITLYTYDDASNILFTKVKKNETSSESTVEAKTYDKLGNVLTATDGNGNAVSYQYNALGKVRTATYPHDSSIAEYIANSQYDRVGNLTHSFDNNAVEELFTFDKQGRQLSYKQQKNDDTDAIITYTAFDRNGNKRFETDGNGNIKENTFDVLNRIQSNKITVSGVEQITSYGYDADSNLLTTTDWLGNTTTNEYDPLDRVTAKKDANNVVVEKLGYNNNDVQKSSTDALNNTTLFTFDKNNRLLTTQDSAGHVSGKTYDYLGNVKTEYDGKNSTTTYEYDEYKRLAKVTNAKGEMTVFSYDLNGNMLTQSDGNGNIKTFEYNVINKLTRSIDHGGRTGTPGNYVYDPAKTVSYSYYKDGNTHTMVDRNGNTTTYTYDSHNRCLTQVVGAISVINTYDGNGNQLALVDSTGTTSRTYDALNRVLSKTVPVIGTTTYTYNITQGLPSGYVGEELADPKGNTVLKVYDKANRLFSVTDGTDLTTYQYFANGAKQSVTYSNGAKEEYVYLEGSLLSELINRRPDGTIMDTYIYTYDQAHNQTSKCETINSVDKGTTGFAYDSLNRLLTVTEPTGRVTAYTYDAAGNRSSETIAFGTSTVFNSYSYNTQNRLDTVIEKLNGVIQNSTDYTYDNNGNELSVTRTPYINGLPQTAVVDSTNAYNLLNQLTQTQKGSSIALNTYNGEGLRVAKSVDNTVTRYLYEYDKVILETDNNANETARNVYGTNLLMRQMGNEAYYYFYNGHADVTALIDVSSGAISATYYYDAFGNILESSGAINNSICYAGYQYDKESGYYYLNSRMYDPKTARFLQEDTYTGEKNDPLSLNLYTYCANEPIKYADPTGHWFGLDDLIASATGAIAGAVGQYVGDVVSNVTEGKKGLDIFKPKSSWETYVGAAVGGAVAGEVMLHTANPILAGAAYGGTSTLVGQGLEAITGRNPRSLGEIAANTIGNTVGGAVGGATFMATGSPAFAGAAGGGVGTATSELLQNAFGVSNHSTSDIIFDTANSTLNGFVVGGICGKVADTVQNGMKGSSNSAEGMNPKLAMADGPDIGLGNYEGNGILEPVKQTPVQENYNRIKGEYDTGLRKPGAGDASIPKSGKTFQTYTKTNPETGEIYSGRTSGEGTPLENIARRDANHYMNDRGFGPAKLDQSSSNSDAIRGREQQLIDKHGGAKSHGGTSGNRINGISNNNPKFQQYFDAAEREFIR